MNRYHLILFDVNDHVQEKQEVLAHGYLSITNGNNVYYEFVRYDEGGKSTLVARYPMDKIGISKVDYNIPYYR